MFYTNDAGLSLTFSVAGTPLRKTVLTVYNVNVNETSITFDSVTHRAANYIAAYSARAYVFREETYSTYGPVLGNDYVTIYANKITGTGVIQIKKKSN